MYHKSLSLSTYVVNINLIRETQVSKKGHISICFKSNQVRLCSLDHRTAEHSNLIIIGVPFPMTRGHVEGQEFCINTQMSGMPTGCC